MPARCILVALITFSGVSILARSQSVAPADTKIPEADRSTYLNKPVYNPEALSGVWEASDRNGGAIGIHLQLSTMISGDADPPMWTPQSWQHLEVGVFHRKGAELVFGEENYFTDSPRGGSVTLENDRLQLRFVATIKGDIPVDLDLTRESGNCWRGRFHRGDFDSSVRLCRPVFDGDNASPLVGTWSTPHGDCIHIFETGDDAFTGWSDLIQIPGQITFSPAIAGPHLLYQQFGVLAKVHLVNHREVSIELNAFSAMCCSRISQLTLSEDGSSLLPAVPDPSGFLPIWTKAPRDSCFDPNQIPKTRPGRLSVRRSDRRQQY